MSDTAQGEGWWIASDDKWYPPETHPDYVAASTSSAREQWLSETQNQELSQNDAEGQEATERSKKPTKIFFAIGVVALVSILGFLGFRLFGGSTQTGAETPELAAQQFLGSIHSFDPLGVVEIMDPAEVEAWLNGFTRPLAELASFAAAGHEESSITEDASQIDALIDFSEVFTVEFTGTKQDTEATFKTELFRDSQDLAVVSLVDVAITVEINPEHPLAKDSALVFDYAGTTNSVNLANYVGKTIRVEATEQDEHFKLTVTNPEGETTTETFNNNPLRIVTVEKDGRWYISLGYSAAESLATVLDINTTDYGRALTLIESQQGGSDSAQSAVEELLTSAASVDNNAFLALLDPVSLPYAHDVLAPMPKGWGSPIQWPQSSLEGRRIIPFGPNESEILETQEWNNRTLVTIQKLTVRSPLSGFNCTYDADTLCVECLDRFEITTEVCVAPEIAETLNVTPSELLQATPNHLGIVTVERNGRWFIDLIGTFGYLLEQATDTFEKLPEDVLSDPAIDPFEDTAGLVASTGPNVDQPTKVTVEPSNGHAAIGLDLYSFDAITSQNLWVQVSDIHLALVEITSPKELSHVYDPTLPEPHIALVGEYDFLLGEDQLVKAGVIVAAKDETTFSVHKPQVVEVGTEAVSVKFNAEGHPILFRVNPDSPSAYVSQGNNLIVQNIVLGYPMVNWLDNTRSDRDPQAPILAGETVLIWGEANSTLELKPNTGFSGSETGEVHIVGDHLPYLSADSPDKALGMKAPEIFGATSLRDGSFVSLDSDKAHIFIFVAHWCPRCQDELPEYKLWLEENELPDDIEVIVVSSGVDENRANYPPSAWFSEVDWPTTVIADDEHNTLMSAFGLPGIPTIVAVDSDGIVTARGYSLEDSIKILENN